MFYEEVKDKMEEACGVFGIYAPGKDVARLAYYALYALQHRGQQSAGIAVSNGKQVRVHKGQVWSLMFFLTKV